MNMMQLRDELHDQYQGVSCMLMRLIDECHNQQNIFGLYPVSDDKTFVLLDSTIHKLKLN